MRQTFLCFFICSLLFQSKAQSRLHGQVHDGAISLDFVQVFLKELDGTFLSYSFTDSVGRFELLFQSNSDSLLFAVARLGYQPYQKVISSTKAEINVQLDLSIENQLMEVIVTENKPVENEGDTLNYDVLPFLDGSEKNVEDLLAKLPGVSVDQQSGKVKYHGKEIKKILLDGDDLTGDNYKVLSKNLSAEWLADVQILKRFTDSRLLHGIQQSDEVAINLKLKQEAKAPLFGTIEAGGGNTWKYKSEFELLSYYKKLKLFALGEANNTGEDLQSYDLETYTDSHLSFKGFILPEPILNNLLEAPAFLKPERFTFHEGQFFSNSMIVNLSSKTSLRSITTLYNNKLNFNFSDSLFYFLPFSGGFSFTQRQAQIQKPFEFFQDIKTESQISSNQDLIIRLQGKYTIDKPITTNFTGFSTYQDFAELNNQEWYVGLSYLNRLNQKWVNTLDIEVGNNIQNEHIGLTQANQLNDSIRQKTNQDFFNFGVFNQLDGIIKESWFFSCLGGVSVNRSYLNLTSNRASSKNILNANYEFTHLFSKLKIQKKFKNLKLSAVARGRHAHISYQDQISDKFYFEPTISIHYKKSLKALDLSINGIYNIEYAFFKPHELVNQPLLTNYRNISSYVSDPARSIMNEYHVASVKIQEDTYSFLSANAEWFYVCSSGILAPQLNFQNGAVFTSFTGNETSTGFFSTYSLDKYFDIISSTIKVAFDINHSQTPLTVEGQEGSSELSQNTLRVTSGTTINKQLNLSLAFKSHSSQNKWNGDQNDFTFHNYFAKLIITPTTSLRFAIDYQAINFRQTNDLSSIFNANIAYSVLEDRLDINVSGNNLTNRNAIILSTVDPSILTYSQFRLQPMFIFVSMKYRF